mgnify:CR=1 FL=1
MTREQEEHLQDIMEITVARMSRKYRLGQAEHGGNLTDMPVRDLIENSIDEAIDQLVYLITLRSALDKE